MSVRSSSRLSKKHKTTFFHKLSLPKVPANPARPDNTYGDFSDFVGLPARPVDTYEDFSDFIGVNQNSFAKSRAAKAIFVDVRGSFGMVQTRGRATAQAA